VDSTGCSLGQMLVDVNIGCLASYLAIHPFANDFVVKNKHFFILNSETRTKGTRQLNNLYHPITNLTVYQKGAHYMGIRIFNNLPPPHIKEISNNIKKFEKCLKRFLLYIPFIA